MLLALSLAPKDIVIVVLAVIAVVAVVGLFYRIDTKIEDRRKTVAQLSKVLMDEGFERASKICDNYVVGDYDGFLAELRALVQDLLDKETRLDVLRKPFEKQLAGALKDPERREKVLKALAAATEVAKITGGVVSVASTAVGAV